MATGDYLDGEQTRALQESAAVRAANLVDMQRWTAYCLMKAVAIGDVKPVVTGYVTLLQALSGQTPRQMVTLLGLRDRRDGVREADLATGADLYRLKRVPGIDEFWPRGYSTLVDGYRLRPELKADTAGYKVGQGAWQIELRCPIEAEFVVRLGPDEPFKPPIAPSLVGRYGRS